MFVFGSLVQYKGVVQSQNENTHHGFVLFVCLFHFFIMEKDD